MEPKWRKMEEGKTVLVKKVNSRLWPCRYSSRYLISTELSTVFSDLYGHTNCFAFHNNEVIRNLTELEDGDEVVVKQVRRVVFRKEILYSVYMT